MLKKLSLQLIFGGTVMNYKNYFKYFLLSAFLLIAWRCSTDEIAFLSPRPEALAASQLTPIGFRANWKSVLVAESYFIDVATDPNFSNILPEFRSRQTDSTSVYVPELNVNQVYYYRIRAKMGNVISENSNIVEARTNGFAPPVSLAARNPSLFEFTAHWKAVAGANSYLLDIATDQNFEKMLTGYKDFELKDTLITVKNLSANRSYFYRVRAKRGAYNSDYSKTIGVSTDKLPKPTIFPAFEVKFDAFRIRWNSVAGAENYTLEVAQDPAFADMLKRMPTVLKDTFFLVEDLRPATNYYFRVKANAGEFSSDYSDIFIVLTAQIATPVALPAKEVDFESFKAYWKKSENADAYLLDVATDFNFTEKILDGIVVRDTSYLVKNLDLNNSYFYRLRSRNGSFISNYSNVISLKTPNIELVTALPAKNIDLRSFWAIWQSVSGAESYILEVAKDAGFSQKLTGFEKFELRDTTYLITGLLPNTNYFYRVCAKRKGFITQKSTIISLKTDELKDPRALIPKNVSFDGFTAQWETLPDVDSYVLEVSTDANFSPLLPNISNLQIKGNSFDLTGLKPNTLYYYRIRAKNGTFFTNYSNIITVVTKSIAAPTAIDATSIRETSFVANWKKENNAKEYILEVSLDGSFTKILPNYKAVTTRDLSFEITGLNANTTYFYRLKTKNGDYESAYSNIIEVKTLSLNTPNATQATNVTPTSFTANWDAVSLASSYLFEVATDVAFTQKILSEEIIGTRKSLTGLITNKTYYYRLKAKGLNTLSDYSNIITVVTTNLTSPVATAATQINSTNFGANWDYVAGASEYLLDVATDNTFTNFVAGYKGLKVTGNYLVVVNLTPSANYFYRVKAQNANSSSNYSNTISVSTIGVTAPVTLPATDVVLQGATLNWQAVDGAGSYILEVATDAAFTAMLAGYPQEILVSTSRSLPNLNPAVTYFYRLKTKSLGVTSVYSNVTQFTTPSLLVPTALSATTIFANRFNARWTGTGEAAFYEVTVATDVAFTNIVYQQEVAGSLSQVTPLFSTYLPRYYYYRIRAKLGTSYSNYSSVITVNAGVTEGCRLESITLGGVSQLSFTYNIDDLPEVITHHTLSRKFEVSYLPDRKIEQALLKDLTGTLIQTWDFDYTAGVLSGIRIKNSGGALLEYWTFTRNTNGEITNLFRHSDLAKTTLIKDVRYTWASSSNNRYVNKREKKVGANYVSEYTYSFTGSYLHPFKLLNQEDLAVLVTFNTNYDEIFPFFDGIHLTRDRLNSATVITPQTARKGFPSNYRIGTNTYIYNYGTDCTLN